MINVFCVFCCFHLAARIGDICPILNDFLDCFCHFNFFPHTHITQSHSHERSTCKVVYVAFDITSHDNKKIIKMWRKKISRTFYKDALKCMSLQMKQKRDKQETARRVKLII